MATHDLLDKAQDLEQKITHANSAKRLALQPELSRVLACLRADGHSVPSRLRSLDMALCDEAAEAWFDNMPV